MSAVLLALSLGIPAKFVSDVRGSGIIKTIVALFIAGALLPSAIVLVSNSTAYTGADDNVALICYMVVPLVAGISIALGFLKRSGRI